MAFESYYWKKNIKRDIGDIRKRMDISVNSLVGDKFDEAFSIVEIKLFMMAFSIRKLLDARKLPDSVAEKTIKVTTYKRNKEHAGIFDFEKLYDYDNPIKQSIKLSYLLNQFIHAYVFQVFPTRKGNFRYLYVTSDWDRRKYLYHVDLKTFLRIMEKISNTHVTRSTTTYDQKTGEFVTKNY